MSDVIVYLGISDGGGVDGRDSTDKGGRVVAASLSRTELEKDGNKPWFTIKPEVLDLELVFKELLEKLNPVQRLAMEEHYKSHPPANIQKRRRW